MRSYIHHTPSSRSTAVRRTATRPLSSTTRNLSATRSRAEHAAIAEASAAWEHEVALGLAAFVGHTIPLLTHEGLTVAHVCNLAEDETFAGWYNWRGITNPDMVLLGTLVGGQDDGATAAIAVDAKLSARSSKTQVLTSTLAQLLEPFQPLTNLVDSLLGDGASERLVLRDGFHVVRGVQTTIGVAAKSTRALLDPEFAAEFNATRPVSIHRRTPRARDENERPTARRATRAAPLAPRMDAALADRATMLTETVWSLDRLAVAGVEMPEPKGVYRIDDIFALDDQPGAPADLIVIGAHGAERVAQAIVCGAKRPLTNANDLRVFLGTLPGSLGDGHFRIIPPFRVIAGKTDTLAVLGNRRTVTLSS